ncbi:hypothetical protein [Jeotgalibacillus proteolyticus]|uniref:Uncharacterized protein n=1 Tax=Jeotgalibacillus proteolyticus TaxID=2082395 RepID=A0A2S5GFC9_9BACL|nr:hypothetical protein [Jeotgalibacillus proteolyticus]PPA71706.1 hypothetical protein C4B60_06535 [Jeotgalibacillus proteolyticus]
MKKLAWFLLFFYLVITVLWIANSLYLFTLIGVVAWVILIISGFIIYKKLKEKELITLLLLYSSFFMLFLLILTIIIQLTVSSMP